MGTETKHNGCPKNTSSSGDIPKVIKGSSGLNQNNSHINNGLNNEAELSQTLNGSYVPFLPIYIDENNVIEGAKEILREIRPHWDLNAVEFKKFTDGITNKLVGCFNTQKDDVYCGETNDTVNHVPLSETTTTATTAASSIASTNGATLHAQSETNDDCSHLSESDTDSEAASNPSPESGNNVVLVRVYGNKTDLLIDRRIETRNIILLHSYGFAPSLYAVFKNGLAYDYVPGVTLNTNNVLRPEVWRLVARRMADMHRVVKAGIITPTEPCESMLWTKTQKFFDLVPVKYSDPDKHKRLEGTFLPINRMRDEFEMLYKRLEALNSPLVFAHNDILLGNVVYTESLQTVNFIDYEYADYNFQAFDIGNHFAEFAGVDEVDYSRYPKRDYQYEWLRVYLHAYLKRSPSDAELHRLYVQVNQFALAAHFFWTIWSLIQAEHSTIDFDYVDYAFVRYNEYLARKDEFLALTLEAETNSSS